ncbi:MAG: YqgE/AlgH family protein [Hyphomicrobiaceae bacterium]|nr:MAG: YqgE/AlgH family protein [Hyphomicrobiaceae bacterium]
MATTGTKRSSRRASYLDGQLLIAMPGMRDPRFARSVIYMCAHSKDGAMGLIINQKADFITLPDLLVQAKIVDEGKKPSLPPGIAEKAVHIGGPVDTSRGFVLHSGDYATKESTLAVNGNISLTVTIDVLKAISAGRGPKSALVALGYAGWDGGQLEREIQANGWLSCPAEESIVFDADLDAKYDRALAKLGVRSTHLVSEAGHA